MHRLRRHTSITMLALGTVVALYAVPLVLAQTTQKPKVYGFYPGNDSTANTPLNNLKQILDYIYESPEFLPLTMSIVSWSSEPDIVSIVSRLIAGNETKRYQLRSPKIAAKNPIMNRADLTWVLIVEDPYVLRAFVRKRRDAWKAKNQYIIIYTNPNRLVIWKDVLKIIWKTYNVYRIIVTSIEEKFACFYTYSPFEKIREDYGVVRKIHLPSAVKRDYTLGEHRFWTNSGRGIDFVSTLTNGTRLFEDFRDFKGYPMRVTVFESLMMHVVPRKNGTQYTGLDAIVMGNLEHELGARFRINVLKYQRQEDPFQESLRMLENGDTELIVTGFFTKIYSGYQRYAFTVGVSEDQLCFIAPTAGIVPKSYMPFQPFQPDLWLMLVVCNLFVTTLWFFIKHCVNALRTRRPILLPLAAETDLGRANAPEEQITVGLTKSYEGYVKEYPLTRSHHVPFSDSIDVQTAVSQNIAPLQHNKLFNSGTAVQEGAYSRYPADMRQLTFPQNPMMGQSFQSNIKRSDSKARQSYPPYIHPHVIAFFDLIILSCYPLQGAHSASQKVLLITTLFFGLIVTSLYQSGLVSGLSNPAHYPELTTMEQVANSNMTIVTKYRNLKRDTFPTDTPLGRRLREKVEVLKSEVKTNDLVAYGREVIALGRYSSLKLENLSIYYDEDGNELLHIVDECPATYILSYVANLYSPWLERINNLLLRMHEAGLIDWWYKAMLRKVQADEEARKAEKSGKKIKLTLQHYSLAFLGLFVGLICCTAVFLAEVYFAKSACGRGLV